MFIALVVVTVLSAVVCLTSAGMKLRRNEQVLAVVHGTVGVPQRHLPGLVAYFLGAVIRHLRLGNTRSLVMPIPRSCSPARCSVSAS